MGPCLLNTRKENNKKERKKERKKSLIRASYIRERGEASLKDVS